LIVTHPDLDHLGGVAAVLMAVDVGAVLEPALPTGKEAYVAALEIARTRGVPWLGAEVGRSLMLDGLVLEVLHPPARGSAPEPNPTVPDANEISVVLAVRFGEFDALLTGDAPAEVERIVARQLEGGLEVLKVAHHGSDTSTDSVLLARGRPHVGLVSVGRGNRYGHPSEDVLHRLRRAGVDVRRTDLEGTLRVVGRRDGSFRVEGTRPPGR
jgi:competence protein ComEC